MIKIRNVGRGDCGWPITESLRQEACHEDLLVAEAIPQRGTHVVANSVVSNAPLSIEGPIRISSEVFRIAQGQQVSDGLKALGGVEKCGIAGRDLAVTRFLEHGNAIALRGGDQGGPPLVQRDERGSDRPCSLELGTGVLPREEIGEERPPCVVATGPGDERVMQDCCD